MIWSFFSVFKIYGVIIVGGNIYMKTFDDDLNAVKGEFFSPFSIVVTVGLIGLGISIGRSMVSKFTNRILLVR